MSKLTLLAFALTIAAAAAEPALANDTMPAALARAAADYDIAQVTGDRAKLERLLAPDYTLVNGAAEVETKAQLVADFTDPAFKLAPYQVESPTVRVWRDGAVLAGQVHLTGTNGGKPFAAHTRFVDVWRLSRAGWQVVFTQVTRVPARP